MNIEAIIQMISSVGFPIVATLILGYLLLEEKKDHKEEIATLTEAIHSNTLVMTELKLLLTEIRNKGDK